MRRLIALLGIALLAIPGFLIGGLFGVWLVLLLITFEAVSYESDPPVLVVVMGAVVGAVMAVGLGVLFARRRSLKRAGGHQSRRATAPVS